MVSAMITKSVSINCSVLPAYPYIIFNSVLNTIAAKGVMRVRAPAFRGVSFVRNQKESCRTPGEQAGRGHERIGTLLARARAR